MKIHVAQSDDEILACMPVIKELRPDLTRDTFVSRVRAQQATGYQMAFVQDEGRPVAVAGYRFGQNLAWGRFLYIDDLVTLEAARSHGHGARLLGWLRELATSSGCGQLHLDSGLQREAAHRFYEREGMQRTSYHFAAALGQ